MKQTIVIIFISVAFKLIGNAQRSFIDLSDLITQELVLKNGIQEAKIEQEDITTIIKFDSLGKISTEEELVPDEKFCTYTHYFYEGNNLIKIITKNLHGIEISTIELKYEQEKLISRAKKNSYEHSIMVYNYDSYGNLESSTNKQFFSWNDTITTFYKYDSHGRIKTINYGKNEEIFYSIDEHKGDSLITTDFNEANEILGLRTIIFNQKDQPESIEGFSTLNNKPPEKYYEKMLFYYDQNDLVIKTENYSKNKVKRKFKKFGEAKISYKFK